MLQKSRVNYSCSSSLLPKEKTLTTTEGEHPQLCLCISSTLLKLLTDSACSQSDDLPCCARITRTSATFCKRRRKSVWSATAAWKTTQTRGKIRRRARRDRLQSRARAVLAHPTRATTCRIHRQDASAQNNRVVTSNKPFCDFCRGFQDRALF